MSNKAKWAATAIAIVLAFVAIAAAFVGIFSDGFTNWDKFKPEEEQTETAGLGGMVVGESAGSGMKLMSTTISAADYDDYGISPMAETAYLITASVTPADAFDPEVDWSVAWANSSSAWASGKTVTNYVTVTPTSDGALTANVECLQAFGEQVIVTATSRDNPSVEGSCTADYMQRYLGTETKLSFVNSLYYDLGSVVTYMDKVGSANMPNKSGSSNNTNTVYSPKNSIEYTACLSDTYTLPFDFGDITFHYYLKLNSSFASALKSENSSFTDSNMATDWVLFDSSSGLIASESHGEFLSSTQYTAIDYYYVLCNPLRSAVAQGVYYFSANQLNAFLRAAKDISDYHFEVKVVVEADGESYETVSKVKFNASSLNVSVTGISLDESNLVF